MAAADGARRRAATSRLGALFGVAEAARTLAGRAATHARRLAEDASDDARDVARELRALRDAARESADRARDAARGAPRFARVAGELLRLAAAYRLEAGTRELRRDLFGAGSTRRTLERLHEDSARRLHDLCVELRGGVLKVGQFASSRIDLLPDAYVDALSRLQDRVPAVEARAIRERIDATLGPRATQLVGFEETPLAAASLAQVHGATLASGERVVVKVRVPGVERAVEADLAALRVSAPALAALAPGLDLETIADELCRSVTGELDYAAEARSAVEFAACFADDPDIVVPRVHESLCGDGVLVLERLDGVRIVDYLEACDARGEAGARDRDRVFEILIRSFCAQVLEHGLCHADPHPGNFLVLDGPEGPRLGLLDFGSVARYTAERRRAWAALGLAIVMRDEANLPRRFADAGFRSRTGDDDSLRAFGELMLEHFREGASFEASADPRAQMQALLGLLRENPVVRIPGDFVQLGRLFAALGGLVLRHRPNVDLFRLLAPRIAAALATPQTPDQTPIRSA